jgi:SAM-dependent methyltransferase
MSEPGFHLTVPGTDDQLTICEGNLVGGGHQFAQLDHGIWDITLPASRPVLDRFASDYARVREAEGRSLTAEQVRLLPAIDAGHPLASMWAQRQASFEIFQRWLGGRAGLPAEPTIVDIGAGCGWLAARLATDGWQGAAVDITVEGGDGLAAGRHHDAELVLIRAEMGTLPFASESVDLAVFNASLHYATDVSVALAEARRIVRPHGYLAVIDSPIFQSSSAGHKMVEEFAATVQTTHGFAPAAHLGTGFVTWSQVELFGFAPIVSAAGPAARFHRWRGARRAGREVAQRPQLVASSSAHGVTA